MLMQSLMGGESSHYTHTHDNRQHSLPMMSDGIFKKRKYNTLYNIIVQYSVTVYNVQPTWAI